ncbi:MAG TPA: DEAD/DEAH box helicase [Chloroflexota bacterium]|nr:DEAD/DEAH box helicase [Chloroflexota bacterium]
MEDGFEALGIGPEILRAVSEVGYERPTPVQQQSIPALLQRRDIIAQSQTGTGKTAAFAIPMIDHVDPQQAAVQGLVLCPTRELTVQVAETIHKLGKYRRISDVPIYGGQPYDRQLRALRQGVQIVVGTPGRIMDHMRRGTLDLSSVRDVVLDEADQMLDMGFIEDIEFILDQVPPERQIALFSATLPPRIRSLAQKYLRDPVNVRVASERLTVPEVEQTYVETTRQGKLEALCRILDLELPESVMIFVRTKREADELGEGLTGRGYAAETIHGDLSQGQRERAINALRSGRADILVATDVAARGLDIPGVSHVINYDIPVDPEAYVHRIGRTARAGQSGTAITFVTPRERGLLRTIERLVGLKLKRMPVPTATDIAQRRAETFRDTLRRTIAAGQLDPYLLIVEEIGDDHDLAEIAAGAIKLAMEEQMQAPSLAGAQSDEGGMERLFIRIGRRQGVSARDLVGAIANEARIAGRDIGAVDIYDNFSFVDVPRQDARRVVEALERSTIRGRRVSVSIAEPAGNA